MRKLLPLLLLAAVAPAAAQNVELSLRPIPTEIGMGQQTFLEVEATFPDTCTFGPEGELSFALNIVPDSRVDAFYRTPDPGPCGEALTRARAVFGPLPFELLEDDDRMEISFTLERGDGLTGFGETAVDVVAAPTLTVPEPGFWWNPAMSGHGLALDRQSRELFGGLFSYDGSGQATWRTFQATLVGDVVAADLLGFAGGNCLFCGEPWMPPGLLEDKVPLQLAFDGPGQAWLRLGPTPGLAIGLQRFHLNPAARSRAGDIPATVPDLEGNWVRIDGSGSAATVSSALVRIERLDDQEPQGDVVYGLFETDGSSQDYTLTCAHDPLFGYRSCGYATEVGDPGPPVYLVPSRDIGTGLIVIRGQDIRYLRAPGGD